MESKKAQLSLEFLLLLAAAFAFALIFANLAKTIYSQGLFALDVSNAGSLLSEVKEKTNWLSFFSDGSTVHAKASFFGQWKIYAKDGELFLEIKSLDASLSKTLSSKLSSPVKIESFSNAKKMSLALEKHEGAILIKNAD